MKTFLNGISERWRGRFAFLRWPLDLLGKQVAASQKTNLFSRRAAKTCYPMRAVRYWWACCALLDESKRQHRQIVIADIGCNKGYLRQFIGHVPGARWVGLDKKIEKDVLLKCGYEDFHECDLDGPLPLPDHSVDVIVFLHVIEHLPRPSFTMQELSRILRPGGLLLAGSPVAPRLIARIREAQLRWKLKKGKAEAGGHINSMDCKRWRTLAELSNLDLEIFTGAFLIRWSGSPLENHAWWLRLNQLWGALFPSLGGETYLAARKRMSPALQGAPCRSDATRILFPRQRAWAWISVVLLVSAFSLWFFSIGPLEETCPVREFVSKHQDGNDLFYAMSHPAMDQAVKRKTVRELSRPNEILSSFTLSKRQGKDPHFLIAWDSLSSFISIAGNLDLRIVESRVIKGVRFALLSVEAYSTSPDGRDGHAAFRGKAVN